MLFSFSGEKKLEKKLISLGRRTTANGLNEYARNDLLRRLVYYGDQKADDFLEELIRLRHELNVLGDYFNQEVHRLHMLDQISENGNFLTHRCTPPPAGNNTPTFNQIFWHMYRRIDMMFSLR